MERHVASTLGFCFYFYFIVNTHVIVPGLDSIALPQTPVALTTASGRYGTLVSLPNNTAPPLATNLSYTLIFHELDLGLKVKGAF